MAEIKPLTNTELASFAREMHLILKAGISDTEGILIMNDDADEADRRILEPVLDDMNHGTALSQAMENTHVFPAYMIHLTEIGEKTGNLDTVMDSLSAHYLRREEMRRTRISAVYYPVLLTCIMTGVILILLIEVMPVFESVYASLGAGMNGTALVLLQIGSWLRRYGYIIILVILSLMLAALLINASEKGHAWMQNISRHFRSVKETERKKTAAEFAATMSMVIASGMTAEDAAGLELRLNENPAMTPVLTRIHDRLAQGSSLADALKDQGLFSSLHLHMIRIGERTGSLDTVCREVADLCEEELSLETDKQMARTEPILILVLSLLVGIILLSVMLPLIGIMSSF